MYPPTVKNILRTEHHFKGVLRLTARFTVQRILSNINPKNGSL